MAKVLLVIINGSTTLADEQGPASIVSYLKNSGHEVRFIAARKDIELNYDINEFTPDVVGLSVYHDDLDIAYEIADYFKSLSKNICIVMGGYSATYYYEEILESCNSLDFLMRGEGELTWKRLCECIDTEDKIEHLPNLIYKDQQGSIIVNSNAELLMDLDLLGSSNRDILVSKRMNIAHMSTSRGCLGNCSFCYSHKFFDPSGQIKWRGKSPEVIVNEISKVVNEYGIFRIVFDDASFEDSIEGLKRMERIVDLIIANNIKFTFEVFFRASIYRRISGELFDKLKEAGLTGVFIGIESFNEKELRIFNKQVKIEDNDNVITYFRNRNVNVKIGFINVTPYSTVETLRSNAEYLYKNKLFNMYLITNNLRAYKGTNLYNKLRGDGLLQEGKELDYYGYVYEKAEVGEFYKYFMKKIDEYNSRTTYTVQSLDWYNYATYPGYISYYRSILSALKVDLDSELQHWEQDFWRIISNCNQYYFEWYSKLLDLLEQGWNIELADQISDKYMSLNLSEVTFRKLNQLILKFHCKMLKYDRNLDKYLIALSIE